jgi:hypothetical protein
VRNGCQNETNINDERALEVDENSTRDRLGRDDYYKSHYLMGPVATIQGLLIVSEALERNPDIVDMLQKAIAKSRVLRESIDQYFEEKEHQAGDNEHKIDYLIGPLAGLQGLAAICATIGKDQEVLQMLNMLQKQVIELRKRINQYFDEKNREGGNEGKDS